MTVETINSKLFATAGAGETQDFGVNPFDQFIPLVGIQRAWFDYMIDTAQRSILFWDAMRQRGNIYLEHRAQGEPPILDFAYEIVLDARTFKRPANYALLRVLPKPGMTVDPVPVSSATATAAGPGAAAAAKAAAPAPAKAK